MRTLILALGVSLLFATPLSAEIWWVFPDFTGDAPTIQAGIDSASVGDVVMLGAGNFHERDIVMKSGITVRGVARDSVRIIPYDDDEGFRAFFCVGCDSTTVIEDLTIDPSPIGTWFAGAGIFVSDSEMTIRNCRIKNGYSWWGGGGAIYVGNASPTIEDCLLHDNRTDRYGGAIACSTSTVTIRGCDISMNEANQGGGLWVDASATASVIDCVFRENWVAVDRGGAVTNFGILSVESTLFMNNQGRWGGAIACEGTSFVSDCEFLSNRAEVSWDARGGAVDGRGELRLVDCLLKGNSTEGFGAALAWNSTGLLRIERCTIVDNVVEGPDGTIYIEEGGTIEIVGCTTSRNGTSYEVDTGVVQVSGEVDALTLDSNVFWDNSTSYDLWILQPPVSATVSCCVIDSERVWGYPPVWMPGNLLADPLFCDPDADDFRVADHVSPCLPWNNSCGVLLGAGVAGCNPFCSASADRYVPSAAHGTIGSALSSALPGEIVGICAGDWEEAISLPSGVHVQGAGTFATTISSPAAGPPGALVEAAGLSGPTILSDLTVDGGGGVPVGVDVISGSHGLHLRNTHVTGADIGIRVASGASATVGGSEADANDLFGNLSWNVVAAGPDSLDATYNYWGTPNYLAALATVSGPVILCPITDGTHSEIPCDPVGVSTGSPDPGTRHLVVTPNPIREHGMIQLAGPSPRESVDLAIYDVRGRRVRSLFRGPPVGGIVRASWDTRDGRGQSVSAGVYFARLVWGQGVLTERIFVLR